MSGPYGISEFPKQPSIGGQQNRAARLSERQVETVINGMTELARYYDGALSQGGALHEHVKKRRQGAGDHFGLRLAEPGCPYPEPRRVADLGNDKVRGQQRFAGV